MIRTGTAAPLALALLLGSGQSYSREPAGDPNQPPDAPPAADVPAPEKAGGDSPFDYRASEQISEDLSVSFPVDI